MKFGAFIAPYHAIADNPTLAIERDMELVQLLDRLDYDEAWIGEHHSAGFEPITSPELFIAGVAERTRRIRLGTGVSSLSYHHPLILADRIVQLDHQTRGRIMFGAGPGQLPSDAAMLGIDPRGQREMMVAALETILDLFDGKAVTRDEGWFRLVDARLQLLPYQRPRMEVAVACAFTPNGPVTAGRLGASMLSVAASSGPGFAALPDHWRICEEVAKEYGRTVSRDCWRIVAPIHIAETRELAVAEVAAGIVPNVLDYLRQLGLKLDAIAGLDSADDAVRSWRTNTWGTFGTLTCGTPDDIAAMIEAQLEQTGGFGTFLCLAHNAANWEATRRSYELFARHVMPRFQGRDRRRESLQWAAQRGEALMEAMTEATGIALEKDKTRLR
ncbi:MAG: LLM class flavin-dependent oxidoreductase [Sphingomonadales bacterium]|nr:LLM class flavin-dependent oxidoreductase [Sphingomonadales bacterium]